MDESGRESIDGVVSEPNLSSDGYILNCLLVYCHLSHSIELLACLPYCRLIELLVCLPWWHLIELLDCLLSLDRIAIACLLVYCHLLELLACLFTVIC
jgi:hypothetical protein